MAGYCEECECYYLGDQCVNCGDFTSPEPISPEGEDGYPDILNQMFGKEE